MKERPKAGGWLDTMLQARFNQIVAATPEKPPFILALLSECPPGTDQQEWETTCDRCGIYVPEDENTEEAQKFWSGTAVAYFNGSQIVIGYGLCRRCHNMEESTK